VEARQRCRAFSFSFVQPKQGAFHVELVADLGGANREGSRGDVDAFPPGNEQQGCGRRHSAILTARSSGPPRPYRASTPVTTSLARGFVSHPSGSAHEEEMILFTRGNHKLGRDRIWGFGLPSGTSATCPGMSQACQAHCYAIAFERYRRTASAMYRRNLALARRREFVRLVRAFLVLHSVRVVRVHVGGDYFSARYARKWLRIMHRSPRTRFYFYTRSWRIPSIKKLIDRMAALPNCRVWYSVDRATGSPSDVPPRVRLAWLMTTHADAPPSGTRLIFRIRRLRRLAMPVGDSPVCPAEDGVARAERVTCERCGYCWRPAVTGRIPLPVEDALPPGLKGGSGGN
jgi:hypothetical protein